jgi:hypothetical protein
MNNQWLASVLFVAAIIVALMFSLQWGIFLMLIAIYAKPTARPKVNITPQVTRTVVVPADVQPDKPELQ